MAKTHVVETEYQRLDASQHVIQDWTTRTYCGREFPSSDSKLGKEPFCLTCLRLSGMKVK